jgi:hypothetical protein
MDKWPSIPRMSLLAELESAQRRLMRSDHTPVEGADITNNGTLWVELSAPFG